MVSIFAANWIPQDAPKTRADMSSSAPAPQAVTGKKYPDQMRGLDNGFMLTASLCLIFIVLIICVLHVYARYFISRHRQRQRAGVAGIHEQHQNAGLDPSALASLPIFVYQMGGSLAHHREEAADGDVRECAICLSAIEDGEVVRLLPNCEHVLHAVCVDKWLQFNSTCPVCRTPAQPAKTAGCSDPSAVVNIVDATGPTAESRIGGDVDEGTMGGSEEVGSSAPASTSSSFRKSRSMQWSVKRVADDAGVEDLERRQ